MADLNYRVILDDFAARHYIKDFAKNTSLIGPKP